MRDNPNTQRHIDAYKRRIMNAIRSETAINELDKIASRLRYCYQDAFGQDHMTGFAGIPQEERDQWRVVAYHMVNWIAEQLGESVVDEKPEDFQDDERRFLDIKSGLAPNPKPEPDKTEQPKVFCMANGRQFFDALEAIGLIGNAQWTQRVEIIAEARDAVVIRQEIGGGVRLLGVSNNVYAGTPTGDELKRWMDDHPQDFDRIVRQYDRIHGTSMMRRTR